jgi:hypothetical protein
MPTTLGASSAIAMYSSKVMIWNKPEIQQDEILPYDITLPFTDTFNPDLTIYFSHFIIFLFSADSWEKCMSIFRLQVLTFLAKFYQVQGSLILRLSN